MYIKNTVGFYLKPKLEACASTPGAVGRQLTLSRMPIRASLSNSVYRFSIPVMHPGATGGTRVEVQTHRSPVRSEIPFSKMHLSGGGEISHDKSEGSRNNYSRRLRAQPEPVGQWPTCSTLHIHTTSAA